MTKTEDFNVFKYEDYRLRIRTPGKWDYDEIHYFLWNNQNIDMTSKIETYDGLDFDYINSVNSADKIDFSNAILPWKWDYSNTLTRKRYCLMPIGTQYENIEDDEGNLETLYGCLYDYTDYGNATTLNVFVINHDERIVVTPNPTYENGYYLGTINIPQHDIYDYENGVWTQKSTLHLIGAGMSYVPSHKDSSHPSGYADGNGAQTPTKCLCLIRSDGAAKAIPFAFYNENDNAHLAPADSQIENAIWIEGDYTGSYNSGVFQNNVWTPAIAADGGSGLG